VQFEHEFTVPVTVDEAWKTLLDVERIAPCMPGATLESFDGDNMTGAVKVKVGPIMMTYHGTARFEEKDESQHLATISGSGRETRGTGTARATVRTQLHDEGDYTRVVVSTSLSVTGRPAQFGRGVMQEVGGKLIGQFAQCLATEVLGKSSRPVEDPAAETQAAEAVAADTATTVPADRSAAEATTPAAAGEAADPARVTERPGTAERPSTAQRPSPEAIDLLSTAGVPVLRRLIPALVVLVAIGLVIWWLVSR
jgi:carbon monoxide dehydrogenase subunit G